MHTDTNRTPLNVSVYSDYICPFCYIGHLRLEKLRAEYDLEVDWRFLEIHPDNPSEGMPLEKLGYPPSHWEMLMANLARMAQEEGVVLPERTFTTNSRLALKLAQAVREHRQEVFTWLNRALYEAYFLYRENIGDAGVLRTLASDVGVEPELVNFAWRDPHYEDVLEQNCRAAALAGITGTPSYVFHDRVYSGAIPVDLLRQAAAQSISHSQP